MRHKEQFRPVLDAELKWWSTKSYEELIAEIAKVRAYDVEFEGKKYQVEVQVLENTAKYVHVCLSVDDGGFPSGFSPLSESFITQKAKSQITDH
jgi:hypothetical protein